jgi:hypothetical protein
MILSSPSCRITSHRNGSKGLRETMRWTMSVLSVLIALAAVGAAAAAAWLDMDDWHYTAVPNLLARSRCNTENNVVSIWLNNTSASRIRGAYTFYERGIDVHDGGDVSIPANSIVSGEDSGAWHTSSGSCSIVTVRLSTS